jgi:hypothetical protein
MRSAASKLGRRRARIGTETALQRRQRPQRGGCAFLGLPRESSFVVRNDGPVKATGYRPFGTSSGGGPSKPPKTAGNSTNEGDVVDENEDESHLNWKDRKEAPKWMQRIAPTKGGKWPPSPQEAVILASGLALFVWSWTA